MQRRFLTMNVDYIPAREATALIRNHLKTKYPNEKHSVRMQRHAGGTTVYVQGPHSSDARVFSARGFDGMIDMSYSIDHWLLPDGTLAVRGTSGTEGSRGSVPSFTNPAPHPDAKPVILGIGYVFTS
jgi:hypothetical protein